MIVHSARREATLRFDSVSLCFRTRGHIVQALENLTLTAAQARITGVVGPDGAGKTTLMRAAAGLLQPDKGTVQVLDIDVTEHPEIAVSKVGYMPQRFGLYEELTVAENLDLYGDLQGIPRRDRSPRDTELMRMTGLAPFLTRIAGRLSGGMKRKLGLACALVRTPRLLLLDEPTVGVDPVSRRELWSIIERLVHEEQVSVLVSTAYLDEVERCDQVYVLDRGRLLSAGPPDDFVASMEKRVYAAEVEETRRHAVVECASTTPGVVDAVLDRGRLRVVSRTPTTPRVQIGADSDVPINFESVTPRFEDYFVDALTLSSIPDSGGSKLGSALSSRDEPGEIVIEVDNVWRRFGTFTAVREASFAVRRGEIFGLLGANGAGKSTLFRMLCGLLPASSGRLRVTGVDMRIARAAARARIGYVAQHFSLYTGLTVTQNLRFFASAYGLSRRRRTERVRWALEEFELVDYQHAASGDLPLGYRQRLALAGALMHEPEILFLDEATSGVDPLARREFWRRISALSATGVTILVTTHFMEEVEYCHRLVIMQTGRILTTGSPGTIRAQARTPARPEPTMEDAFIDLIEASGRAEAA